MLNQFEFFPELRHLVEFQSKIIDYSADGLMVVDQWGEIVYVNNSFCELHNVEKLSVQGKHVSDVIENTRMHLVAQTGIAEHDDVQLIDGKTFVVSRVPIVEEGVCKGVVGVIRFRYVDEVEVLNRNIKRLQKKILAIREVKRVSAGTEYTFDNVQGKTPALKQAKQTAMQAATAEATVFLRGESGVGKECFAQSIHNYSSRSSGPFIRLNCSAIQETLFESELFGYEEGAFTGARKGGRKGKFELAEGGTIFLDEIGDMPLATQAKLLRVIQEKEVDRLGSEKRVKVDVRIIAATNCDLEKKIEQKLFREDLFYRLNVIPINIPPLRECLNDIPLLAKSIWRQLSIKNGIFHKRLTRQAFQELQSNYWKGNIRELRNVLERALVIVQHNEITAQDLQNILIENEARSAQAHTDLDETQFSLTALVENTEIRALKQALRASGGNRSKAAKLLGISRPLLYKKMNKYSVEQGEAQEGV